MRVRRPSVTRIARRGLAVAAAAATGSFVAIGPVLAGAAGGHADALPTVSARSFTVTSTADSHDAHPGNGICADSRGRCTLRAAIEEADAGPAGSSVSISAPAGTYQLTLGSLEESANAITVTGAGAPSTVVRAGGSFRVLQIGSKVTATLKQLTITGGNAGPAGYGGGVLSAGKTTISGSVVSGNSATAGGGVTNSGGHLTITASTISGNDATAYGGGGIQNGGLKNLPGTVNVVSSTVSDNTASGDGGGMLNGQNGHPAEASRPAAPPSRHAVRPAATPSRHVTRSAAPWSRAAAASLRLTVASSRVNKNTSDNAGGGIANDGGTVTVTGSTLNGNSVPHAIGGGIATYGPLSVTGSTLSKNTAKGGYGGGVEAYYGGVPETVTITRSALTRNSANIGGGIDDSAAVSVTASTLAGNSAAQGGGIFIEGSSSVRVLNSTITANTASLSGRGGAIQTFRCGSGTVAYTTISGNSTGLDLSCSDVRLTGTIVASSTAGANCTGAAPAERAGYNLDSGTSCGFAKSTDLNSANPQLGPLADNGGPTRTETPLPGSPAINNGGTAATGCPSTDQRGYHRPSGPACDIGSVEVQG